jgi:hypothetical protein
MQIGQVQLQTEDPHQVTAPRYGEI